MGLGKTIQTIAFLCYLAEFKNIWGPFLVVAPTSTLPNWVNEFMKFAPELKVMPYWGTRDQRQVLRKFWRPKNLHKRSSTFHVIVTSYNLVVMDEKYFNKLKFEYMILDEAQAIKNSTRYCFLSLQNTEFFVILSNEILTF
jgi:DNA helicase INO80